MISIDIAQYFQRIFELIVFGLSLRYFVKTKGYDSDQILYQNRTNFLALYFWCLIFCIIIGFRPLSSKYFGDTVNYAATYHLHSIENFTFSFGGGDWLFDWIKGYCSDRMNVSWFFTIIAVGYVFFQLIGITRIFKNNTYIATLFLFGAFSFWSYLTNGIRNGLSCAIMISAISFFCSDRKRILNILLGILCCTIAFSIHKSAALPIICMALALFVTDVRKTMSFWVLSIILCIVARGPIEQFFINLGFDDRLSSYVSGTQEYAEMGYKTGFRLDFLIYSAMPIILGYYILVKKRIQNRTYEILLNTYILSNSFWVMLMNAAFSNRFAYLSWFMYPIVLAYPCLRMNVWGIHQGKIGGKIFIAHILFTLFMMFIYY